MTLPEQIEQKKIIHVTAAAAAKAAATALLTNQVVRRVRLSLLDGRTASFKVDKCVLESGSALCSVGTRLANIEAGDVPEVCVRVAWEEESPPLGMATTKDSEETPVLADGDHEIFWLHLDSPQKEKITTNLSPSLPVTTTELTGPVPLRNIPLFLHFDLADSYVATNLRDIPRELLATAVREALGLVPAASLGQGVRVYVSLVADSITIGGLPQLQTGLQSRPLFESDPGPISRLLLSLDDCSHPVLPLLVNDEDEYLVDLSHRGISLKNALDQIGTIFKLNTLTIGGGPATALALASGDLDSINVQRLNIDFLLNIAQRRDLDSFTIQSLRQLTSADELIHFISRRRLGWLFDEICRVACLEVRKRLARSLRLEMIVFGTTGAVLGRSLAEPATFRI